MKLILFDIDGTLMDSGGAGTRSMDISFRELFSIENAFEGIGMAGKTDIEILKEGLLKHNLPLGDLSPIIKAYIKNLENEINNRKKHVKPGIEPLLQALSERKNIYLGLLTGNIEHGARIKLRSLNLDRFFPFGAFGSDDADRNRLLPVAVKKFKGIYGKDINYRDCIIVGDTPKDVECAKPYGAYSVAVATGPYTVEMLKAAEADMVFKDLSEAGPFFNLTPFS